jgi:hypothetical protein
LQSLRISEQGRGIGGLQAVELKKVKIKNQYKTRITFVINQVRTLYACVGEHETELSFEPNAIITSGKGTKHLKLEVV